MKKSLLSPVLLFFMASAFGQSIQITEMTASATDGGINVNLKTISFNGAEYIGFDYSISGTTIEVSACYSFNLTLPVLTFENNLFIPVTNPGNYTVNVVVHNSSTPDVCDYYSSGGSATTTVLSVTDIEKDTPIKMFPNPTSGEVQILGTAQLETVNVYDLTGKTLLNQNGNSRKIDLSGLGEGVYIVEVKIGTQFYRQQIIRK